MILNLERIKDIDKSDMFRVLVDFPNQVDIGVNASKNADKPLKSDFKNIVFSGMGGSAIAADILKSYLELLCYEKQIYVNREYYAPNWIDSDTLFIASSYSGNTEETIAALTNAMKKTKNIVCICTGGKLEEIAKINNFPVISLADGLMPRCALGMSFFALIQYFIDNVLDDELSQRIGVAIDKTKELLITKSKEFSIVELENEAIQIAVSLFGKIPVFHSESSFEAVSKRWQGQIQENAKLFAYSSIIPEMNHNEINSWVGSKSDFVEVIFEDKSNLARIKYRIEAISTLYENHNPIIIESSYDDLLSRIFDLIYLGDWVSFYLAILNKKDPTPIPAIIKLKEFMSRI